MLKSIFNFIDDVIRGIIVTFLLIAFTIISALALVFCDMGEFMRMGAVILLMTSVGAIFYIMFNTLKYLQYLEAKERGDL